MNYITAVLTLLVVCIIIFMFMYPVMPCPCTDKFVKSNRDNNNNNNNNNNKEIGYLNDIFPSKSKPLSGMYAGVPVTFYDTNNSYDEPFVFDENTINLPNMKNIYMNKKNM